MKLKQTLTGVALPLELHITTSRKAVKKRIIKKLY